MDINFLPWCEGEDGRRHELELVATNIEFLKLEHVGKKERRQACKLVLDESELDEMDQVGHGVGEAGQEVVV
jgi:hypothetical protein